MITIEEIKTIAATVFPTSYRQDFTDWDPYTLIELLTTIERQYNIVFQQGEWEELTDWDDLLVLINEKVAELKY